MTTVTVNAATQDDIDALVTSVAGLFAEDAGQHDPMMNLDWPAREGAAYYSSLMTRRATGPRHCLCRQRRSPALL
jgi:hypothetical protein